MHVSIYDIVWAVYMKSHGLPMDTRTDPIDDLIAYSLELETVVTSAQKARAWERLQASAAQQVILAPYAIAPRAASPAPDPLARLKNLVLGLGMFLLSDEAGYQRAATSREALYHYPFINVIGSEQTAHFHSTMLLRFKML